MRTPGREAMGGLLRAVAAVAVMAALAGACTNTPDTTLHPDPPAVAYAPLQHPFRGARLFVDDQTRAAPAGSASTAPGWLDPITTRPQARWLNGPQDLAGLPALAARARRQQALLVLVAYYIPNRGCSSSKQGRPPSRRLPSVDRPAHPPPGLDAQPSSFSNPTPSPPTASAPGAPPC